VNQSRVVRSSLAIGGWLVASLHAVPANAFDIEDVDGETLTFDITNTATIGYRFDNRNTPEDSTPQPTSVVDDSYGEWLDRLNIQAYYGAFRAGVRIDAATYFLTLNDTDIYTYADERLGPEASGVEVQDYANAFRRELHSRFQQTYYPSKLFIGYTKDGLDLTLGDFYVQLGRGLVFSVRKVDELAADTTVRGAKVQYKDNFDDAQLSLTTFAGQMNPIRVDETSGRRLNGDGSPFFFGFPTADRFKIYSFDESGRAGYLNVPPRPSYLEDSVFGTSVEAGPRFMQLGGHVALVLRKSYGEELALCEAQGGTACSFRNPTFPTTNEARLHDQIVTASTSINFPRIDEYGDLYVEVAGQHLGAGRYQSTSEGGSLVRADSLNGYALYGTGTLRAGPLAFNVEGKHYRSFFPLSANINGSGGDDAAYSAPEFDFVSYNQVPTVEPTYTEFGNPNLCVTGGRGRADVRLSDETSIYAWLGHYVSFTEIDPTNTSCETEDALRTNTWDSAAGGDIHVTDTSTIIKAWVGLRDTERGEPAASVNTAGETGVFYREGYLRYDVSQGLVEGLTLTAQGVHRHRYEPSLARDSWNEGENYTALQWSPHFAFIFGYEYLGRPGCTPDPETKLCNYFSGGLQFRAADLNDEVIGKIFDSISLFVGQRRGAIRCVSGVCRQFPPYEGAKLEIVSRF
jgi:hypothetical protein